MNKGIGIVLPALCALLCASTVWAGDRQEARADYAKGQRLERERRYADAIKEFEASLDADPSYAWAELQLGDCYYYLGDKAEAVRHYDRFLDAHPGDIKLRAFADSLRGKDDESYAGAITVDPVSLIFGEANAQYERRWNSGSALAFRALVWDESVGDTTISAFGLGAAYHFYPGREALHHFYWGPALSLADVSVKVKEDGTSASGNGYAVGPQVEAGWQWVPYDVLAINLGAYVTYYVGSVSASSGGVKSSAGLSGISGGVMFSMGYAWH